MPGPLELNTARDALLNRVVTWFCARPDVLGVFLSGSLAAGTADEWSDIDLGVLATEDGFDRLFTDRFEAPRRWGEWLFNEWTDGVNCCVSHFRPFLKLDVCYYSPRTLRPSPWHALPTRIFHDPAGVVADLLQRSRALDVPPWERVEVGRLVSKALASAHECLRRARRGELMMAQAMLAQLRDYMARLDEALRQQPPWVASAGQREHHLDPTLRRALGAAYVPLDAGAIEAALRALAGPLGAQIESVHRTYALERSLESDQQALALISTLG